MENQICYVANKSIRFLWFQGLARDLSKYNEHFRNIFSVRGFPSLSQSDVLTVV